MYDNYRIISDEKPPGPPSGLLKGGWSPSCEATSKKTASAPTLIVVVWLLTVLLWLLIIVMIWATPIVVIKVVVKQAVNEALRRR